MLTGLFDNSGHPSLLIGSETADDAAVYALDDEQAIISTTDFFMPVVDDPYDFGRIAAANAISDVYAMGGTPMMALAILGWPVNTLPAELAREVLRGGRDVCREAGIPLAGGHSIDAPEPIFGLSVNGRVKISQIKRNNGAKAGDRLYLTKPLGIGILSTAIKKGLCKPEHEQVVLETMCQLNRAGATFAAIDGVHAMTDVTGFGLLGHLLEMCNGSRLNAVVYRDAVPLLPDVDRYIEAGCAPGGSMRNYESYRSQLPEMSERDIKVFLDPQTSGGLLIAVSPESELALITAARDQGISVEAIGTFEASGTPEMGVTLK